MAYSRGLPLVVKHTIGNESWAPLGGLGGSLVLTNFYSSKNIMASGQPPGLLKLGILSLVYMVLGPLLMEYAKLGFDPTMGLVGSKKLKNRGVKGSKLNNVLTDGFFCTNKRNRTYRMDKSFERIKKDGNGPFLSNGPSKIGYFF